MSHESHKAASPVPAPRFGRLWLWALGLALLPWFPLATADDAPPAVVALVLDTSGLLNKDDLARARDLATGLLGHLPAHSSIAVFSFDDQSRLLVPRTERVEDVRKAIAALSAAGRYTALHDAIFDASRYLSQGPPSRRAIVLVTDGKDENSVLTLEDGVRLAQQSRIPVFAVGVGRVEEKVLRRIAKLTDGDFVNGRTARAKALAERIGALPVEATAPAVEAAPAAGPPSATPAPATTLAGRAPPHASPAAPAPAQTGSGRRWAAVILALALLAAVGFGVMALRRKPAPPVCPSCQRELASALADCPHCSRASAPPTAPPVEKMRPLEEGMSPTVVERMNLTEEYLEKTITLRERPILNITRGPGTGQVFELSLQSAISVGRSKANDIVVADVSVSSQHCRIRPEDGRFVLHDLKSTNGTYVNERKVTRHPLVEGDVIKVGETSLVFKVEQRRS